MSNDQALVEAFQSGDRDAFAALIRKYQNYVASIAYSSTGDFSRSEDITQQTFLTAWSKQGELSDSSKWRSWLRGITRNLLLNDYRKRSRERALVDTSRPAEEIADNRLPEQRCISDEQSKMLWSILEQIPETYREPLVLYYREGQSVAAVAEMLELSEDVVKQRLSRGRKLVKSEIAQFVEESLFETRPSPKFSAAILAALPSASSSMAGKVGGSALGSLIPVKFLLFAIGPLIGIAGAVFGSKKSLDSATSSQERRYMWKMIWVSSTAVLLMIGVQFLLQYALPDLAANPWIQGGIWTAYTIFIVVCVTVGNQRISEIKKQFGTEEERSGMARQMAKPISTAGIRWNLIAMIGGMSTAVIVLSILASDWVFLAISIAVTFGLMLYVWHAAPAQKTVPQQLRFNGRIGLFECLILSGLFLVRWGSWVEKLNMEGISGWWLISSSWLISGGITGLGLFLFALLHWQASKINSQTT